MPAFPEPSYEELKEENQMLRQAIYKLLREHIELPSEEELIQQVQNADFSISLTDVINELKGSADKAPGENA